MGIGDDIIATGMARGARARGRRIAFGDQKIIRWGPYSAMVFKNNPNIAPPGKEHDGDIEWIKYYKGHRVYNSTGPDRWIWNYDFKVKPGEFFLDDNEEFGEQDFIIIEPNVPNKPCGQNKQWPVDRFKVVADELIRKGFRVKQFYHGRPNKIAPAIDTISSFRRAVGVLKKAKLAILPEGGLHHAAAAVGCPAIVLFGGFTPPAVLGYDSHINLTSGVEACGKFTRCQHCLDAMNKISVEEVLATAEKILCH